MSRILVVDDEPRIVSFVSRALSGKGFAVDSAFGGLRGLELAQSGRYDLVVLDLMLPDLDGVSVLRGIVAHRPEQPVLVLSAVRDVNARVRCLELGAVDYMPKPFALPELMARIRARLRKQVPSSHSHRECDLALRADGIVVDPHTRTVDRGAGAVVLTPREFALLERLMRDDGEVCSRQELLADVWGYSFDPGTNVVDVYVGRLRKKLGKDVIECVRDVGYRRHVARTAATVFSA